MRIFGLVGRSGSGKTSLIVRLLRELRREGLTVSTIRHAHHGFDLDRPGKDSFRHREAGAKEVMLVADERWALMHENCDARELPLEELVRRMAAVDVVLIEGFHTHRHPAIEVYRPSEGHALMWRDGTSIVAVASDEPLPGLTVPLLDLNDAKAVRDIRVGDCGDHRMTTLLLDRRSVGARKSADASIASERRADQGLARNRDFLADDGKRAMMRETSGPIRDG